MDFFFPYYCTAFVCIFVHLFSYISATVSVRQGLVIFLGCARLEIFICDCIFVTLKIISIINSASCFVTLSYSIRSQCEKLLQREATGYEHRKLSTCEVV